MPDKLIVGLGKTGLSCARYFAAQGQSFAVTDSRQSPPGLNAFRQEFPGHRLELGGFGEASLLAAESLVISPGVSLKTPAIARAMAAGVPVTGDIDIFSRVVTRPIVAVTGSNGKSTVVSLVAAIFKTAGIDYGLGGNLEGVQGKAALDLLREPERAVYVLELSSFQLETTVRLGAEVSTILNISEDHMDRYDSMAAYRQAKQRIFLGSQQVVVNRDDADSRPVVDIDARRLEYGLSDADDLCYGIVRSGAEDYLASYGEKLIPVDSLRLSGQHNVTNVLAAMTLAHAMGVERSAILRGVQEFSGLPNRCQWVARRHGVDFYNDSKGTNVGATVAAVSGLGQKIGGKIVLIAGGEGKGANFSALAPVLSRYTRAVVLIGVDGPRIAAALPGTLVHAYARDMQHAVQLAAEQAREYDAVLLSPACASFDMFRDFQHRGQVFTDAVEALQ